jgi:hypothetical protein
MEEGKNGRVEEGKDGRKGWTNRCVVGFAAGREDAYLQLPKSKVAFSLDFATILRSSDPSTIPILPSSILPFFHPSTLPPWCERRQSRRARKIKTRDKTNKNVNGTTYG